MSECKHNKKVSNIKDDIEKIVCTDCELVLSWKPIVHKEKLIPFVKLHE